jgi:predicted O-linked N-acetylglucosamine transferase (SPINDLY family)
MDKTSLNEWYELGLTDFNSGAYPASVRSFRRALDLAPNSHEVRFQLGRALFYLGELEAALVEFRQAAEVPDLELRAKVLGTIACIVPGSPSDNNASILEARRAWAALVSAETIPARRAPRRSVSLRRKLRLGYCSKFFHARNWMKPVFGVINNHNRADFELHLFSDGMPPSLESGYQPNELDHVHDVRKLSNEALASFITRTRIDVLVDLNGYSYQGRLGVFMRRPAPVIVGWFNMYATTGIDAFDYIIGDAAVIPAVEEKYYCERVLRVPGTYLAHSVPYAVPEVSPPPCLAAGHLTFASLCSQYKINDDVVSAWATILRQAPKAQLLVRNSDLAHPTSRGAMHERFERRGIASNRILLEGPAPHEEFLETYARADIALDAFPYNGGTTTMEALWQGVPVLTFSGNRWASRQSRSLLLAAGLDEWCMPDREAYIARAVALARSSSTAAELASLRSTLRGRLARMPVCDCAGLCRALEQIFRDIAQTKSPAKSHLQFRRRTDQK